MLTSIRDRPTVTFLKFGCHFDGCLNGGGLCQGVKNKNSAFSDGVGKKDGGGSGGLCKGNL